MLAFRDMFFVLLGILSAFGLSLMALRLVIKKRAASTLGWALAVAATASLLALSVGLIRWLNADDFAYTILPRDAMRLPAVYMLLFLAFAVSVFGCLRKSKRSVVRFGVYSLLLGTTVLVFQFIGFSGALQLSPSNVVMLLFAWLTSVLSAFVVLWLLYTSLKFTNVTWSVAFAAMIGIDLSGQRFLAIAVMTVLNGRSVMVSSWQGIVRGLDLTLVLGLVLGTYLLDRYSHRVNGMIERLELAKEDLSDSEGRYRMLVEKSPVGMLILQDAGILYASPAAVQILGGQSEADVLKTPVRNFIAAGVDDTLLHRLRSLPLVDRESIEVKCQRLDGRVIDLEVAALPMRYNRQPGFQLVFQDVTERKRAEEVIRFMAYHDSLTELPNRTLFKEDVQRAVLHRVAYEPDGLSMVVLIDLDRFKNINDTMGHTIGDEVLKAVARKLLDCVGERDVVCRLGGDEFAVLVPCVRCAEDVDRAARGILQAFREPFLIGNKLFHVSGSLGVAVSPDHGNDVDSLLQHADIAMYAAKEQGKATYRLYTSELNDQYVKRLDLEESLRLAIKDEQFEMYYQPIVDTSTQRIVSLEALIRWQRPQHGIVSPAEFIALAEETGLILLLGEWVTRTVCRQVRQWLDLGYELVPVAINVSAAEFRRPGFVERLRGIVEEAQIEPRWIQVEITETTVIDDMDHAVETLNELREMGISSSMDDFGVGYSSLNYLRLLPVDKLKIDYSFINDLSTSSDQAIVQTIIQLAKCLGLTVVAEGVETDDEFRFLRDHGCDHAQGYLFSRPLPTREVVAWFDRSGAQPA